MRAWIVWLLLLAAPVLAEERFPPPDFESGYTFPNVMHPVARSAAAEYGHVAALAAALALAAWLALRKRSRLALGILAGLALAWFGFWRKGCICPIGATQNLAQALFSANYVAPLSAILFWVLPLICALLFGRVFCASVCPQGAIQDLLLLKPLRIPLWLETALGMLPFLVLGLGALLAATGTYYLFCGYDPFIAIFRLTGSRAGWALGAVFLALSLFIGRPYCRFLCPYGALLNLCSRVAWRPVTVTPDVCIRCRLCENACPFNAIRKPVPLGASRDRATGKRLLAALLVALPLLMAFGGWLGFRLGPSLARLDRNVQLADLLRAEAQGQAAGDERSAAFHAGGGREAGLFSAADDTVRRLRRGAALVGAWCGLVVGLTLIGAVARRRQEDYVADAGRCFACGRCFRWCPRERLRRGEITADALPAPSDPGAG